MSRWYILTKGVFLTSRKAFFLLTEFVYLLWLLNTLRYYSLRGDYSAY